MSNLPAVATDLPVVEGLEDFDAEDMVMPTLTIDHEEGEIVDTLSGERHQSLEVVLLGLVKARVLWHEDPEEKGGPLCRSLNFTSGIPDRRNPHRFPWKASGFNQTDFDQGDGTFALPCEKCPLKEWGSHPKNDTPWCTEQHKLAVMLQLNGGFSPAIFTVQRTGIKPSRAYLTSFARSQTPTFVTTTVISLAVQKKGSRPYAVPQFVRGTPTDEAFHEDFAANYRRIRDFLTTPRFLDAEEAAASDTPVATPTTATPAAANLDDDEMPF